MPAKKKPEPGLKAAAANERTNESPSISEVVRRTVTPPNLPVVYANGFQIAFGPLDVRMLLLETFPMSPTEVVDKQLLSVIMTPETLKLLAENLQDFVERYENQFGKIRDIQLNKERQTIKVVAEKTTGD